MSRRGTAYGLDSGPDLDWRRFGTCVNNPDSWSTENRDAAAEALYHCGRCPVLRECHADAQQAPAHLRAGVVLGGVWYGHRGQPLEWEPKAKPGRKPAPEHGLTGYKSRRCRCGICRAAAALDHRARVGDPDEVDEMVLAAACAGQRVKLRPAERLEAVKRLTARGFTQKEISYRLQITPRSVARWREKLKGS